ncbi:MAG: HNH endonuclease [Candidatus Syntrophonatronum acetioxidans]|uniref:Putative HNH nuclease YajD n=1 Tax=Candidatus Syntrophonatronum acetioxidans TaxID=1795816 RepID=A0A424YGZ5_9FIRM|nr:MAG: HNH endonuclease [Candidatus Syntrophonatronum acetioxidans]
MGRAFACRWPGCPELVTKPGYCQAHAKQARDRADSSRESAVKRGYSWNWHKIRKRYIARNPYCEDCRAKGIIREAKEVHHVRSIREAPHLRYSPENLRALCLSCHAEAHRGGRKSVE